MKKSILFLLMIFFGILNAQNSYGYRKMILSAEKSPADAKAFLAKVNAEYNSTKRPVFLALAGVGNFFEAKHSFNPIKKMSFFNKGKQLLEEAVKLDANNLEIRFLRYISQMKTPKILGYYHHLEEDEKFLKKNYSKTNDMALQQEIKRNIETK